MILEKMSRLDAIALALCCSNKVQVLANLLTQEMGTAGTLTLQDYHTNIQRLMEAEARAIVHAACIVEAELQRLQK